MDPKSRPTPAGQLVYEDFEPQYQWVPRKDVDTLVVDLTGFKDEAEFKKENLKVKIDNQGNLKVSGERPLGDGNRWRRFQKVFRMAEDCITTDIKAKFDNGVLSVSMPKLIKDPASSTLQQQQQQPPPPPPPAAQAPGAASAAPPAKPEPRAAAASSTKAPEEGNGQAAAPAGHGRRDTAGDKEKKPAPPQSPNCGRGTRRRWRQVVAGVVVVMVVAAVGLGLYCYWAHWNGVSTDEQEQMDIFLGDY